MGLDYSTQVGYGFSWPDEDSSDLLQRLGVEGELMGFPDREILPGLGFPGLSIIQRDTMGDPGGWAVVLNEGYHYLDPATDDGIWLLNSPDFTGKDLSSLIELRKRLFPSSEGRPKIGWLLVSSIW